MGQLTDDLKRGILDQSSDGPNWGAFVEWMAEEFEEVIEVAIYLMVLTWLDSAEGVWLDRIGRIVGVTRPDNEELIRVFRTRGATDPQFDDNHGFCNDAETVGGYLSGRWGVTLPGTVDDDIYREVIYAKIAGSGSDASVPGIARYIYNGWGLSSSVAAGELAVRVTVSGTFDLRQRRYMQLYAPRVAGVDFTIVNWPEF